jgi:hypothetical protein
MKLIKATTTVLCLGFLLSMSSCIFRKASGGHSKAKGSTTVVVIKKAKR